MKRASAGKGKWWKVPVLVLTPVLAAVLCGAVYLAVLSEQIRYEPDRETLSSSQVEELLNQRPEDTAAPGVDAVDPEDVTWETFADDQIRGADVVTVLLIGQDRRPGEVRARSDVMILCTLNRKSKELTLSSLMRDLYLPIPGYAPNRLNVPYLLGGMELLKECISRNFGIRVDGCVEVDFEGFVKVVELMDGVELELTAQEAAHLSSHEAQYGFPEENWNLTGGKTRLTPHQALAYARMRNVGNADFDRTGRQRKLLSALLSGAGELSLGKLHRLLMTGAAYVTTDMSRGELVQCAVSAIGMEEIDSLQIPAPGTFRDQNVAGVGLVLVPDLEANRRLLHALYD